MLSVYSTLLNPFISVRVYPNQSSNDSSIWGIQFLNNDPYYPNGESRFQFGVVSGISYGITNVYVGQRAMVDKSQAWLVTQGGENYYITDANTILMTEKEATALP